MGKEEFNRLVSKFNDLFTEDSDSRIALGLETDLEDFSIPTVEQQEYDTRRSKRLLREFKKCSRRGLTFDEKLDLELGELALKQDIFSSTYTYDGKTWVEQMPMGGEIGDGIFRLFINDPRPLEERLNNITARLENAPVFLRDNLRTLKTPVKRWVDLDIEMVGKLPELFDDIYNVAENEDYPQLRRMEKARDKLNLELRKYKKKLRAMPTTQNIVIGDEQARELVRLNGIDTTFEEMHVMAKDFFEENKIYLSELRQRLVERYKLPKNTSNHKLHCFLNKEFAVPLDKILDTYKEEMKEIVKFIKRRNLFEIPSKQEIELVKTPKYLEPILPAGAMDSPPPFRKGVKKSIVYLTLNSKLVDEHTRLKIPGMMVHEGIPGHHLQYATAYANKSIIRKHLFPMEHAEGWTTMLEELMLDEGYMEDWEDEARFIGLIDLNRIGARVGIDLYFMTGEIEYLNVGVNYGKNTSSPFANAEKLLREVTGFSPSRVRTEINGYSQMPGYPLSYLVGNRLVWELKEDLAEAQGRKLRGPTLDREFHKVYLESGCMPIKYLRTVFEHKKLIPKIKR